MSSISPLTLAYCIRHMVLPPKLPQKDDTSIIGEDSLLELTLTALQELRDNLSTTEPIHAHAFDNVIVTVRGLLHSRNGRGNVAEDELTKTLHKLATADESACFPLHLRKQNAALMMCNHDDYIIFESFELSPQDEQIMDTPGRLIRPFPSRACRIHRTLFLEEGLVKSLAQLIAKLSCEEVPEFRFGIDKVEKSRSAPPDTPHPGLITDYLVSVLSALGSFTVVDTVTKKTREEVLDSSDGSPWRRSPLWLLIRVAMQLGFLRSSNSPAVGLVRYKVAMVHVLAKALGEANREELGSNLLRMTCAKLVRRLDKLEKIQCGDHDFHNLCTNSIRKILAEVKQKTSESWKTMTEKTSFDIDADLLQRLQPQDNVKMSMNRLDVFLSRVSSRASFPTASKFEPSFQLEAFDEVGLKFAIDGHGDYRFFQLALVETWVEKRLKSWVESNKRTKTACERLFGLQQRYFEEASSLYESPISRSLMYITTTEIWKACDMCTCENFPLLKEYDMDFTLVPFQALSLPEISSLRRLRDLEQYIEERKKRASPNLPSVFGGFGHDQSFAVRYYDNSSDLPTIRSRIEKDAEIKREKKMEEFEGKKKLFEDLISEADKLNCENHEEDPVDNGRGRKRKIEENNQKCTKCRKRMEAMDITINVHEWPLHVNDSIAKATVFEIAIPEPLSYWRDATMHLIKNVLYFAPEADLTAGSGSGTPKKDSHMLKNYTNISSSVRKVPKEQRVGVSSKTRPAHLKRKHYQDKVSVITKADIIVVNQLPYRYVDSGDDNETVLSAQKFRMTEVVGTSCTYKMPSRSPQLQRYLNFSAMTGAATPKSAIASVSECPLHLAMDEYKALSLLPLGYKIQYMNILAQICSPAIDLAKFEAHCMFQQIVHVAGPPSNRDTIAREAHGILRDDSFSRPLMRELDATLQRGKTNWERWRALSICVLLARRVLNFTETEGVRTSCFELLEKTREIALDWLSGLDGSLQITTDDTRRTELICRKTEVALLCIDTFNVDDCNMAAILQTTNAVSVLLQMSIIVRENKDAFKSEYEEMYRASLQSWRGLIFRLSPTLQGGIQDGRYQADLDSAVKAVYPEFKPYGAWTLLPYPKNHWIHTKSEDQDVYLNILTANLFIDGRQPRLPKWYESQDIYQLLFKDMPIEVMPTREPGMKFSAKHSHCGYQLSFGAEPNRPDMLVVATQNETKFDLIPRGLIEQVVPYAFVYDYVHWYNHTTKEIEFRTLADPWVSCDSLWRLKRSGTEWIQENKTSFLVNPSSMTGNSISAILQAMEEQTHIHVMLDKSSSIISIGLIRLGLDFIVHPMSSSLSSCQYPGLIIDSDQRIGTLVGLKTKLVLRKEHGTEDRTVLIPRGEVKYRKGHDHVEVLVVPKPEDNGFTKVHDYRFDKTLARLEDDGTLESKLLLCYLHALTSHCLVDPATGVTGTEAALLILRSAAVSSFEVLRKEHIEILKLIGNLTPSRSLLSKSMQHVQWDEQLPSHAQHPGFFAEVKRIFQRAYRYSLFTPNEQRLKLPELDNHTGLLQRDRIRSAVFRADGFGAEEYTREFDRIYLGRAVLLDPNRGQRSSNIVRMVLREEKALVVKIEDLSLSLYAKHFKDKTVQGNLPLNPSDLNFVTEWLEGHSAYLPRLWCSMHYSFSGSPQIFNKFAVAMCLSTMAFAADADMDVIQTLALFYRDPEMSSISIPPKPSFDLGIGYKPSISDVERIVRRKAKHFEQCPERVMSQQPGESDKEWRDRKTKEYKKKQKNAITKFARAVHSQWPCVSLQKPNTKDADTYIDTGSAMSVLSIEFDAWHDNLQFNKYIQKIEDVVSEVNVVCYPVEEIAPLPLSPRGVEDDTKWFFGISDIFKLKPPLPAGNGRTQGSICWPKPPKLDIPIVTTRNSESLTDDGLSELCEHLVERAKSECELQYVDHLRSSREALEAGQEHTEVATHRLKNELDMILRDNVKACEKHFQDVTTILEDVMRTSNDIGWQNGFGPRIRPTLWLRQLNRDNFETLSKEWQKVIVDYGLTVTALHRAHRLLKVFISDPAALGRELSHRGHENWSPLDFPETLLLEIEGRFMVRKVQEEIAKKMRDPPGRQNSVLQLNCGEGKSSVIVPMLAAAIANKNTLVRVIVGKPQSAQMSHMLRTRISGLLNRPIAFMPFSRSMKLTTSETKEIGEIFNECIQQRGVLLVQPEQILSFRNMCIEKLIAGQDETAQPNLEIQELFDTESQDIIDESDEQFSPKFEVCYTLGTQKPIDLSPDRWTITQTILSQVHHHSAKIRDTLPGSIEVIASDKGGCPRVRLLRPDAESMLLDDIAKWICKGGTPRGGLQCLPIGRLSPNMQVAFFSYVRNLEPSEAHINIVEGSGIWNIGRGPLLLLRGLIAGGILRFALTSKRWRVNYGLDFHNPPRTRLAIPYRSKDKPSPNSEFSHPDVVIILTCLSYYYGGLNMEDIYNAFVHLSRSDQNQEEYIKWVSSANSLPGNFHRLENVNTLDRHLCETVIFPAFRYSKSVIDYFLAHIVFTKEGREFPKKLCASGWNIGIVKPHPTTGFSGTNDARDLLPLSVNQLDLEEQKHTNAMVLLQRILEPDPLQAQNSVHLIPPRDSFFEASYSDGEYLIETINATDSSIRVLLDVGAQILDLTNREVAQIWLTKANVDEIKAAIFFSDDDELLVVDRSGGVEPLQTSPRSKRLEECLVFFDEAHTRGIDLNLPRDYRAACTLGANLTKDKLVQACMRLRKLGEGQSVVFFIPEEIQNKIRKYTSKSHDTDIEIADVLAWTIQETWADLKRCIPLWANQGRRFENHKNLLCGVGTTNEQASGCLEEEAQTLEQRYRPKTKMTNVGPQGWDTTNKNLREILKRCETYGTINLESANFEEEQERELAPEVEEERRIERPATTNPEDHNLDKDLKRLIEDGGYSPSSRAFIPAFKALGDTSAARALDDTSTWDSFDIDELPSDLLVTKDYIRNVKLPPGLSSTTFISDSYHLPVQWVLSVVTLRSSSRSQNMANLRKATTLIIISPYEADQLLDSIRKSTHVTLHIYAPRLNRMYKPLDSLGLYTVGRAFNPDIPRSLIVQLNLFSGQLYLKSYDEYIELCAFLGLASNDTVERSSDGFILPPSGEWKLRNSPVRFFRILIAKVRREGEAIEKTHMGRILEGEILKKEEFEATETGDADASPDANNGDDSLFVGDG